MIALRAATPSLASAIEQARLLSAFVGVERLWHPVRGLNPSLCGLALGAATVVATEVARLNGLQRRGSPHCGCKRPVRARDGVCVYVRVSMLTLTYTLFGLTVRIERLQPR